MRDRALRQMIIQHSQQCECSVLYGGHPLIAKALDDPCVELSCKISL